MLSFNKLLVLVAVILAVIVAYRVIGAMKRQRDEIERLRRQEVAQNKTRPKAGPSQGAEDMRRCPACNSFVVAGSRCGRADCPMG